MQGKDIAFTKDEVFKVLCSIDPDKSCGLDNVPGRLLKEAAPWIAEPLARLSGQSHKSLSPKCAVLLCRLEEHEHVPQMAISRFSGVMTMSTMPFAMM